MIPIKVPYSLKRILRDFMPPVVLRGAENLFKSSNILIGKTGEKGREWYDNAFNYYEEYRKHYTESEKFFLYSVIADQIMRAGVRSILDVGCGSGQFSQLLRDRGFVDYYGIDFSRKRIEWAKKNCPDYRFVLADALESDIFEKLHYDCVVSIEFLEHVEKDVEVITRVKSGTIFYGTVPNFTYTSHVRHFNNPEEVHDRYAEYFNEFRVTSFIADTRGKAFYLFEVIKK